MENKPYEESRIGIILALAGEVSWASYWMSILRLKTPKEIGFKVGRGNYGDSLNAALKAWTDWDALFLTEWDHTYEPDIMERLWNNNKPVIGAMYRSRQKKSHPYIIATDDGKNYNYILNYPRNKVFEVDSMGIGALLIRKEVFEKLKTPFIENAEKGADVAICRNIKKSGFKIYCDPTIPVGHLMYDYIY